MNAAFAVVSSGFTVIYLCFSFPQEQAVGVDGVLPTTVCVTSVYSHVLLQHKDLLHTD